MRFLSFLVGRSGRGRWLLAAAVLIGMVAGGSSVGLLVLISRTLQGRDGEGSMILLAFLGLIALVTLSRVASQYLLAILGQDLVLELRLKLARQILATPLAKLEELRENRLLASLTGDIEALTQALVYIPVVCINGTIVLGCLGYLAVVHLELFLMLVVVMTLGAFSYQFPAQAGMRRLRHFREEQDVLFQHFQGLTDGTKELQLHRPRRNAFLRLLETTAEQLRGLRVSATVMYSGAAAWGHLLFFVVIGLLLYARPEAIGAGRGTLIAYTLVLLYMMGPLQTMLDSIPTLGRADVAVAKVLRLGFSLASEERPEEAGGAPAGSSVESLELRGIIHTYQRPEQADSFTLGPVDFSVGAGELVFVVGGNGSGKTTFAKILLGLYGPDEGEVLVDGVAVDEAGRDDYRQHFSAVFTDFHLFASLLGLDDPEVEERARGHLRSLDLDHKVDVVDGRLSTVDLSQGQRKRLALLTAYLEDRPIYVFDEWAADQDPAFKEVFYCRILPELKRRGKAVVVITHDDRYFRVADRVVKLEDGRVVYSGDPASMPAPARQEPAGGAVEAGAVGSHSG